MHTKLVTLTKDLVLQVTEDTQFVVNVKGEGVLTLEFSTAGVAAEILAPYLLKAGDTLKFTTIAKHIARNTSCITKVKGVLQDNCSSDYVGKIIIEEGAQQTSSFLEHNVLVIGEGSKNNSQPILEIAADDVKASHGSTTGRVDAMQVYYLMTRGLSREEAQEQIVSGFFTSILNEITDATIRSEISKKLI